MNRRDFLKRSALGLGGLALLHEPVYRARPWFYGKDAFTSDWQVGEKFGRVCQGKVDIRKKPFSDSESVKSIYDDAVVPWLREVVGEAPGGYGSSRWVETPDGYIYASRLQPVWNKPNKPLAALPVTPTGKGMWVEVSVPYSEIILKRPASSMWLKEKIKANLPIRVYHNMILYVDDLEVQPDGTTLYRVNERYGNPGDLLWVNAEALRPITEEEISPIHPDAADKHVEVNLTRQSLTCYEGKHEVYFCRVSSGAKFDSEGNAVDVWSTPPGQHPVYRKLVALHMSGPKTGDWPAVGWTSIFAQGGVSIHSTYWHNYFGVPRSHGCVNCAPDDAKWVWRWLYPSVGGEPGDIDVSGKWPPVGTMVNVSE